MFIPKSRAPWMEKEALLTISSVLISSRESEASLYEERRKEEATVYKCPQSAQLVLESMALEQGAFHRIGDMHS